MFHFTDVRNAASILNSGVLLSRAEMDRQGGILVDGASPNVISGTEDEVKENVRLYFRPRTPTQYNNEGFRPVGKRVRKSHCPMPVVFLFDSAKVLTLAEAQFSNGSLGRPEHAIGNDATFLSSLPFEQIYHDSWLDDASKSTIIFHRHAEVVLPTLDLAGLKYLWCRSPAEKGTFLNLLDEEVRARYEKGIGAGSGGALFFRHWTFVEEVALSDELITFKFNPSSLTPGPFEARLEITELGTGERFSWSAAAFETSEVSKSFNLSKRKYPERYEVTLSLNGDLAFCGKHDEWPDVPF